MVKNCQKRCLIGSLVLSVALLVGCGRSYVDVSDQNPWDTLGYHSDSSSEQASDSGYPAATNTSVVILPYTEKQPATELNPEVTVFPTVTTDPTTVEPTTTTQPQTETTSETTASVNPVQSLTVLEFTQTVAKGNKATVTIRGLPNTEYTIKVKYSSGYSSAAGLEPKISDADGVCSWTWKVGGSTKPGSYPITISDGKESYMLTFTVQ